MPVATPLIGAQSGLRGGPWSGNDDRGCVGAYTVRAFVQWPMRTRLYPAGIGTGVTT